MADAHLEHWLDLPAREDDAYLRQPEVRAEIFEAAGRSVLHPQWRPGTPGWVTAHSTFAMMFILLGELPAAAVHFRAMGGYGSKHPWEYLGDPAAEFVKHRDAALAAQARPAAGAGR